ncbi:MAG: hypothetical protein Q8P30_00290 [Candidatus Uhrbacteria bacterium]|nr:hypothetical protein [Candidatus Uhrbacteria bacterium]
MTHPHESFLNEFKFAIDHMVPLTPPEIIEKANKLYSDLLADEDATEKQIHQALSLIGREEFPYRKAYHALCEGDEEKRLQDAVFERLDASVRKKAEEVTKHGVLLDDLIGSRMFEEQFKPEEKLQIEQAILLSEDVVDNQCDDRARKRQEQYVDLVDNWTKEATRLQALIDRLRTMGSEDPKWTGEINSIADKLEEGWSIVERDPIEEEIMKEIEYWNTVLHEEEEV